MVQEQADIARQRTLEVPPSHGWLPNHRTRGGGCPQKFTLQKDVFATRRNVQEEERNVSGESVNPHFVAFAFLILIFLKTI